MPRATRLSGQLPSPPKSFDGSESSSETCNLVKHINKRSLSGSPRKIAHDDPPLTSSSKKTSRILRRQSTQNVAGEIRAFFAVSALPSGKTKNDILHTAVDSVSQFWEGPSSKYRERRSERSKDDSDLPRGMLDPATKSPLKKHWLTSGLYAGSRTSADHSKILGKSRKSDPGPGAAAQKRFKFTLPIFHGKALMETKRDFKLPWNLYATDGQKCKPPTWSRIKRNIYVDVDPYDDRKEQRPECFCQFECDESCLNRAMFYECDDQTCGLKNHKSCSNRTFQHAALRYADHDARACGFEVFDAGEKGFGLRVLRDFPANSFILEYRGELISTEECEDRMATMYAGRNNYYFLNIDANTVLDAGRKGSEARFANHCCNPNARIEKWFIKGEPRIGVFAGKKELEAGDEITYDYNFSWFEGAKEQKCKCGAENCRGFIGKRKAMPPPAKPQHTSPKKGNKKLPTKVKRIVSGRITKVSKKTIKTQVKNGKVVTATVVTSRTKLKPTKSKAKTVKKVAKNSVAKVSTPNKAVKFGSSLGKRKRAQISAKKKPDALKKGAKTKAVTTERKFAKPRPKVGTPSVTSRSLAKPSHPRPVYDTVSHRSRKSKSH